MEISETLEEALEVQNISVSEVADALGIGFEQAQDLLAFNDETEEALNIGQLRALCNLLSLEMTELIPSLESASIVPQEPIVLQKALLSHLEKTGQTVTDLEAETDWELEDFLEDRLPALDSWSLKQLQDACTLTGLDWHSFLLV